MELIDDEADVGPAPFEFKPYTLVYMLDPKNINLLSRRREGLVERSWDESDERIREEGFDAER